MVFTTGISLWIYQIYPKIDTYRAQKIIVSVEDLAYVNDFMSENFRDRLDFLRVMTIYVSKNKEFIKNILTSIYPKINFRVKMIKYGDFDIQFQY